MILLTSTSAYFLYKLQKAKQNIIELENTNQRLENKIVILIEEKIPEVDIKFIDFTMDMYINYAKDFGIHSETQHEIIVRELQRIKKKLKNEYNG